MNDVLITILLSANSLCCVSRELQLPEVSTPVGSSLQTDKSLYVGKGGSHLLPPTAHSEPRKVDSGAVMDLTKVLFQTSYDERMRKV